MVKKYWRLLRDKDGVPTTLFHGVGGSRILPLDEWIDAEVKTVHDGSRKTATPYTSGFHIMASFEDLKRFTGRFRKIENLFMVQVDIDGEIWDKEHSPANVFLAERMRIRKKQWERRIKVVKTSH